MLSQLDSFGIEVNLMNIGLSLLPTQHVLVRYLSWQIVVLVTPRS